MEREIYDSYLTQSAIQDQVASNQMALYSPSMRDQMQQMQALLVSQVNPARVLQDIILKLAGLKEENDGNIVRMYEPIMNDVGLGRMSFMLGSILNQSSTLSHVEKEEISKLIIQFSDDLTDDLTLNWKKYGIRDKSLLDSIMDAITIPAYLALKRAQEQNEKNWLGKISVENISNAPRVPQPKKEGFLSKFKL